MNRQIKFRAWDKKKKTFVKDCAGKHRDSSWYIRACDGTFVNFLCSLGGTQDEPDTCTENEPLDCYWKDGQLVIEPRYAIQQFTGLLDKNGSEIYEGDILKLKTYDGWKDSFGRYVFLQVRYHELTASFRMTRGETYRGESFDYSDKPKEVEVVGNIFESPELLIAPAIDLEVHSIYLDGDGSIYCYDKEGKDVEYPSIWPDKIEDLVKFMDKQGVRIVK